MKEERLQILRMVQEGILTTDEAANLLAALGERESHALAAYAPAASPAPLPPTFHRRWLRIRVTDKYNERDRVNITLPIALLDWGLRMTEVTAGVSLSAVREVIRGGAEGKILELDDAHSDERVEIFVE